MTTRDSVKKFSAQVLLRDDSQRSATDVAKIFADAGFEVGPRGAGGIPITASVEAFEKFFLVRAETAGPKTFPGNELSLSALPESLRALVSRVVFTTLDFGPGGGFSS